MAAVLPYPIPMPERADLMAAVQDAMEAAAYSGRDSADYQRASSRVALVLSTIWNRYGVDDGVPVTGSEDEPGVGWSGLAVTGRAMT